MTETPVSTLILTLAVPTIISMMVTTIYNTADTFFVSKISVAASGATGIVFSLMAILQAFGFMLGHGAGSNISRLLGARKVANASVFLSTSFFLAIGTGFLIGLFGLCRKQKPMQPSSCWLLRPWWFPVSLTMCCGMRASPYMR